MPGFDIRSIFRKNPQRKAPELIEETRRLGTTTLRLSDFGLEALPPEIGYLTDLRELHLNFNRLKTLPPRLGN